MEDRGNSGGTRRFDPARDPGGRRELFPGESLDLPEENPKHYQNYNNNYGYGRGLRNYNNGYGAGGSRWEDPWEEDPEPRVPDQWDETGLAASWEEPEEQWDSGAWEPKDEPSDGPEPAGEEPPAYSGPAIRAYNADFQRGYIPEDRPRRNRPAPKRVPQYAPEEAAELERYTAMGQAAQDSRHRRKKRGIFRRLLVLLLVIVLLAAGLCVLLRWMPRAEESLGVRKPGCSAILLAGVDQEALRTDTMMILFLDREAGQVRLLSLPRDTYVGGGYAVPKLNSVYGAAGGGKEGMEALMDQVAELIGYRPDGYLLVELVAFVDIVDAMGGVKFDVPQDMYYEDASQDLLIDLKAGTQRLNGQQAMGLVRYRSGYAMADLRRVEVQRDFVAAAMDQWLSLWKAPRYPFALYELLSGTEGDLSFGNLVWIAEAAFRADLSELETATLPGEPADIYGGSYYLLWPEATAALVNSEFNPYEREITSADLNIPE